MKRLIFTIIVTLFSIGVQAQNEGVLFENLTYKELLLKAKQTGKLVFIDCYTSWCGPCKKMVKETFPLKEVGDYMNSVFVSGKFDCEVGEGIDVRKKFGVSSYPTYLILDSDGNLINTSGGFHIGSEFIDILKKLTAKGGNLESYGARYNNGERNKMFIKDYCQMLIGARKYQDVEKIMSELLVESGFDKDYWPIYATSCFNNYNSAVIQYIVANKAAVSDLVGEENVNKRLTSSYSLMISRLYCVPELVVNEEFTKIIRDIKSMNLPENSELPAYVNAINFRLANDYDGLINLYETCILNFSISRRFGLDRGLFMIKNLSEKQKQRVLDYAKACAQKEPKESKYVVTYLNYK